jgi:hypothetical protein
MTLRLTRVTLALSLALPLAALACSKPATPAKVTATDAAPAAAADAAPAPAASETPAKLKARATAAYDAKDYAGCAPLFIQVGDHYSAACCFALAKDREHAFAEVDAALADPGFRDFNQLSNDTDLSALHEDPRWADVLARGKAHEEAYMASLNRELYELYQADQGDRQPGMNKIDWAKVSPRDQARRKRVEEIIAAGGAKVADDYYHAAMVYQHGDTVEDITRARELAMKAVELDGKNGKARWLAAAATDRELMRKKLPQKYGTQYTRESGGAWVLYEVDPKVTDAERAEWNCPPLADARAKADALNAAK